MYNKLLVIDDVIGVVGGCNYQDDYYDWDCEYNFCDCDVLIVGLEVWVMVVNFDVFWYVRCSVLVECLNDVGCILLCEGVLILLLVSFCCFEWVQWVSVEVNDIDFVSCFFVDIVLLVVLVCYVVDLLCKYWCEKVDVLLVGQYVIELQLDVLIVGVQEEVILQILYLVLFKLVQKLFCELCKCLQLSWVVVFSNSLVVIDNLIVYVLLYKYKWCNMCELGFNIFEYKLFLLDVLVDYCNLLFDLIVVFGGDDDGGCNLLIGGSVVGSNVGDSCDCDEYLVFVGKQGVVNYLCIGSVYQNVCECCCVVGSEVEICLLCIEIWFFFLGSKVVNKLLLVICKGVCMGLYVKLLVVDCCIGVVGIYNFDLCSENYNIEGVVIIDDLVFVEQLVESILCDIYLQNLWMVVSWVKLLVLFGFNYSVGKVFEVLLIFDFWLWCYVIDYEFKFGLDCSWLLFWQDLDFYCCYVVVGDFFEVNVGLKWLLVCMLIVFGVGFVFIF